MAERKILTGISSVAWEHPADRAALQTLRSLPGFDEFVRRVASFFGERGVRQLFLGNAVRVGPTQRPKLDRLYTDVLATMDWPTRHELYVTQTPIANAHAVGFQKPFIIVNSGMLELLDEDEQRDVLAHELGHIMSGHPTYTTLALILLLVGSRGLPFLAGLALLPIELALFEWYRKAEFSADRAALLSTQEPNTTMSVFLKLAGGREYGDTLDLDTFMAQAAEYEGQTDIVDKVWQVINTAFRTHPMGTVRAAELQRWIRGGDYDRILRGEYPRRGQESEKPLKEDFQEAGAYYRQQASEAAAMVNDSLNRAKDAFNSAFRGPKR
jgi:Zn-dependent protease with chaperone function